LQVRLANWQKEVQETNRKNLAEYLAAEEEAARRRLEIESQIFSQRLAYNEEIPKRNLDHLEQMLGVEEQRAGIERETQLRAIDATNAQTLEQKVAIEQRKAAIEIEYVTRVHEIRMRLFDLETSRMVIEEEAAMKRLGYRADEIQARIAELTAQRDEIRRFQQESHRCRHPGRARLDTRRDCYVAELPRLAIGDARIADELVRENERMLTDGFYAEVALSYDAVVGQEHNGRAFAVESLRPIQMSKADTLDVLARGRAKFSTQEWIELLLRSVGMEPESLDERARRVALLRMVPFVERNYNLVELGPRGTGKSHIYQQISPYSHRISSGKATVAKMFVNMATGKRGLVCQYDVVCFDEVSGISFDQKDGVNIMKG